MTHSRSILQGACCDSASFDLPADLLADCIREVDKATHTAGQMREAGKRRTYDGLGLRVRCAAVARACAAQLCQHV